MSETVTRSRRGRVLRFAAALAVLLAVASYVGVQYLTGGGGGPTKCSVRASGAAGGTFELTPEQASNAATISAVGITRGMPERAVTIALATALQESGLRNLPSGDRDSLGLFQQRPSAGWGTRQEILDPVYASTQFYEHLGKIPDYGRLPLTVAAQEVQRSGFPEAYAKHEPDATLLAAAFTGSAPAALTCPAPFDHAPGDPRAVRTALVQAFGPKVLPEGGAPDRTAPAAATSSAASGASDGGTGSVADTSDAAAVSAPATTGPGPERSGAAGSGAAGSGATPSQDPEAAGSAALSVPVRALPGAEGTVDAAGASAQRRGWELAHWAVARAGALHITRVAYAGRVWSAADAGADWQRAAGKSGAPSAAEVTIGLAQ
ncbi:hypothetical protein AB0910_10140 [Streptomyces sp. NPDC047002]|uniref:hypothetical protein n=1 Tax=Streptomyces sp. NPDC047002 TaxID=3155475 RepID=UPI0034559E7E